MVETGDADAFITGLYTKYSNTIKVAKEVVLCDALPSTNSLHSLPLLSHY